MNIMQQLESRVPAKAKNAEAMKKSIVGAFGVAGILSDKRRSLVDGKKLTDEGITDALKEALRSNIAGQFAMVAAPVRTARAEIDSRKALLAQTRPKPASANDQIAEMQRQEIRSFLRSLPPAERMQHAMSGDPAITEAVLGSAAALSGLTAEQHGHVLALYVDATGAAERDAIQVDEEAVGNAEAALQLATSELAKASGLQPSEFTQIMSTGA